MKCTKACVVAVALLLVSGCRQVLAWNSVGHMTVAYAAYQRLSEVEKARAATLLKLNPYYTSWLAHIPPGTSASDTDMYVFLMAATWPDEIKAMGSHYVGNDNAPHAEMVTLNGGYNDHQAHKYWHFVDAPFSSDGTPLPTFAGPTLTQKIAVLRAALSSKEEDALKSYDLVWLLHLVGDAHQPLHCATRVSSAKPHGDDGGNLVLVNGSAKELHAFWDGALGTGDTKDFLAAVKVGATLPEPDPNLLKDDKEEDWAAESFALAKSSVYVDPVGPGLGPFTMTDAYTAKAHQIAMERTALAGARLANLLKAALQCGETACAN
jgi:hypothetical protein